MKALMKISFLLLGVTVICWGVYFYSGNRIITRKVLAHYQNDSLKLAAATLLLDNIGDKFAYCKEDIERYDTIFALYDELNKKGETSSEPELAKKCWHTLIQTYGKMKPSLFEREYDRKTLSASFLIDNIDVAFEAWQTAPNFITRDFNLFCRYVLPYRVGNEPIEPKRRKQFEELRSLRDSMFDESRIIKDLYHEFVKVRKYQNSKQMWNYAISLTKSQLEKTRRGSCRHFCEYYVAALRACGIPATIDYVNCWGNRAGGHEWVAVLKDSGAFLAFDALDRKKMKLAYKPAKIYRQTFETQVIDGNARKYVPDYMLNPNRMDVSHLYFNTYDVEIKGSDMKQYKNYPYGVICVFDNKKWVPVDFGKVTDGVFHFQNMIGDVCYMAGFYVNGTFISATEPFVLTKSGEVKLIQCYTKNHVDMRLVRKYPKFTRISSFRKGLLGSKIEVSDDREFSSGRTLITIDELGNEDFFDSTVTVNRPYRYVRFVFDEQKEGNLAEIEFYGKKRGTNVEVLLTGGFSGEPIKQTKTNWTMALDRSFDTYFKKNKGEKGNICLDLGKDNSYEITRVRYVPQTDSNFIVPGNQYRLEYWDNSSWKFFGEQIATDFSLNFSNVPTGRLYILHNLTNGVEERIFTYEDGKQVWW